MVSQFDVPTTRLTLTNLLPPDFTDNFWTYDGSLTTPLCYESVKWVVLKSVQQLSAQQLYLLRNLHQAAHDAATATAAEGKSHRLTYRNYRPLQNLNERVVKQAAAGSKP